VILATAGNQRTAWLPQRLLRLLLLAVVTLTAVACAQEQQEPAGGEQTGDAMEGMDGEADMDDMGGQADEGMNGMGMGDMADDVPRLPPVFGYYAGEEVFFVHPEASDPEIARLLDDMMGSPVPVVPGLGQAPDAALADLYVFTNGVEPGEAPAGPLGFQADVFDSVPGDDGYSPLRRLHMVTWADDAEPRLLTGAEGIRDAETAGEVTIEVTGAVINAPLLSWPGGQR
jgi:hypothetical protein